MSDAITRSLCSWSHHSPTQRPLDKGKRLHSITPLLGSPPVQGITGPVVQPWLFSVPSRVFRTEPLFWARSNALNRYLSAFPVRKYTSDSQERGRRAAVTECLSGLVGEAEQEGGGRKREPGPGREAERDTLEHRPRGPDRQAARPRPRALWEPTEPFGLWGPGGPRPLPGSGSRMVHVLALRPTGRN